MSLRERLIRETQQPAAMLARGANPNGGGDEQNGAQSFQEMKSRLHRAIINRMDLTKLAQLEPEQVHAEVARLAEGLLAAENAPLSVAERERLVEEVRHELFGLGPLEPLLADPAVSDILVNDPQNIYIERRGKIERTEVTFKDA